MKRRIEKLIDDMAPKFLTGVNNAHQIRDRNPDQFHEVRYEDLKTDAPATASNLYRFIDVDGSDEIVNDCLDATSFEKMSNGRKSGEEDTSSFMRKGSIGGWGSGMDQPCLDAQKPTGVSELVSRLGHEA